MIAAVRNALWNPILGLELRGRMRTVRAPIVLTVFLALVGGFGFLQYSSATSGSNSDPRYAAVAAQQLFGGLAGTCLVLVTLLTPGLAASAISGERERQTLDLLLCTPMRAWQIVIGKLLSSLLFLLVLVAASLPLFSLVFFLAGVALSTVVAMIVIIASTMLLAGAIGILASTLIRRTTAASLAAYVAVVLLAIFPTTTGIMGSFQSFSSSSSSALPPGLDCTTVGPVGPCASPPAAPLMAVAAISPIVAAAAELSGSNCVSVGPSNPFGGPPALFSSSSCSDVIPSGGFHGWRYWEVTLLSQSLLAVVCVAVSILALRGRRKPRYHATPSPAAPSNPGTVVPG